MNYKVKNKLCQAMDKYYVINLFNYDKIHLLNDRGSVLDLNITAVSLYLEANSIGDYSSIIGLLITLIGFGFTITQLLKTKRASEAATSAVNAVRHDLKKIDTITDLSSVVAEMEEIKRLHRERNNELLPEKYAKLRKYLIAIKSSNPTLIEEDLIILQGAITQLSASEKTIDKALFTKEEKEINLNTPRLNGLLSNHIDKLYEVLNRVKINIGENL